MLLTGSPFFHIHIFNLIFSSVADVLLSRGYKVRGVTRDASKAEPLKLKVEKLYGPGLLSFVEVNDAAQPGAYKAALEGMFSSKNHT